MIYSVRHTWRQGSHHKVDPQVAGEELERIEREIGLTPANIVDESRPDDAPLHGEFEWDDTVAAEEYRKVQAQAVVRHLVTVQIEDREVPAARSFVSLPTRDDDDNVTGNVYISTYKVLSDDDMRKVILNRAVSELGAFRRKYLQLKELAAVFTAIDQLSLGI